MNFEQLIRYTLGLEWRSMNSSEMEVFAGVESETAMICEDDQHGVIYVADGATLAVFDFVNDELISERNFEMDPIGTELCPGWSLDEE